MRLRKWNCPHCGARNLKNPKRCEDCNKFRTSKVRKKTTRKKVVKKKSKKKAAPVVAIKSKLPPGSYTLRVDVADNGKPTLVWVMKQHTRTRVTNEWRMAPKLDNVFEDTLRKGTQ
jgi:hypothetical protein